MMLSRAASSDLWLLAADMCERATGNVYHGLLRRAGYPPPAEGVHWMCEKMGSGYAMYLHLGWK